MVHAVADVVCGRYRRFPLATIPVLRLTEVTVTRNSLHLAGKLLVLVKLVALAILRPRPRPRPRNCSRKAKASATFSP